MRQGTNHRRRVRTAAALSLLLLIAGCASADVKTLQAYEGKSLPRPDRVVVYDFAYAPDDGEVTADGKDVAQPDLTEEQIVYGRAISDLLQEVLVQEIGAMGLPAERIEQLSRTQGNMLLIHGQFLSVNEGSGAARMLVGFGAGRTKVITRAQAYYFTPQGQQRIKDFEVVATSGSKPGLILPIGIGAASDNMKRSLIIGGTATVTSEVLGDKVHADTERTGEELAATLRKFFADQGWL